MVTFSSAFLAVALLAARGTLAAPWPVSVQHTTHRMRTLPNGVVVKSFHPEGTFETFTDAFPQPFVSQADPADWKDTAVAFASSRLGADAVAFKSGFDGEAASHVYVNQRVDGINVANVVANVVLNKDSRVVAFGNNFFTPSKVAPSTPAISVEQAIAAAEKTLGGTLANEKTTLEYFAQEDSSLVLSHVVTLNIVGNGHLVEAFVDAHTAKVVGMHDFTNDLTMLVLPIEKQDPRAGFETLENQADPISSPNGWTTLNGADTRVTSGNNAIAFKSSQTTGLTSESSADAFEYPQDATLAPTNAANLNAARSNAFYIVNRIHDITYRYGFTEKAFNFQSNNFGLGGAGNDRVTVSVQDSAGTNNADFTTPADGSSGRMRMFLWTLTSPQRDGALENDIVAHENTHGLSNRLTGGGTARCLQTTEAGGMGEGWSDAFAEWTEQTGPTIVDFTMGTYVLGSTSGIRSHPYSTDSAINPLTYADIARSNEVHNIGEIWANTLHVLHDALVTALGFSDDAKANPDATGGNAVFLHLFVDALAIQPCNPTFLTARLAYITADQTRFGGANFCTIWKAFASRGLGVNAANHVNNFDIPDQCVETSAPAPVPDPGEGSDTVPHAN